MKVLLVHKYFGLTGGAEVFFRETGRILENNGHSVEYFTSKDAEGEGLQYFNFFPDPPCYTNSSFIKKFLDLPKAIYSSKAKKAFLSVLKDYSPDIVHVFSIQVHLTPSILIACSEYGVPVVMSCNDYKHICSNYKMFHHGRICNDCYKKGPFRIIFNKCCKDSLSFSIASFFEAISHAKLKIYQKYIHTYLFASQFMAKETERFWGVGNFRWGILRNPFDSLKYPKSRKQGEYALFFGRLADEKGVNVLIQAAQYAPDIPIKIVGKGPDENHLCSLCTRLGLKNVQFLGPVWGEELDSIIENCLFVVVPSIWYENFPYVIIQSFALGKPVVGSDRGGIPEMISHGQRGIVYPAEDSKKLAESMLHLWQDPSKATTMGNNAKVYADTEFNDARQYQTLISIYKEVLSENISVRR